jgi:hypothetical protein
VGTSRNLAALLQDAQSGKICGSEETARLIRAETSEKLNGSFLAHLTPDFCRSSS